jgi:hypothetical protein
MTHSKALTLRNVLTTLLNLDENDHLHVAIGKTYAVLDVDNWTVYLYGDYQYSNFLIELSAIAKAISDIVTDIHAGVGSYDAGTTSPEVRTAITLH